MVSETVDILRVEAEKYLNVEIWVGGIEVNGRDTRRPRGRVRDASIV